MSRNSLRSALVAAIIVGALMQHNDPAAAAQSLTINGSDTGQQYGLSGCPTGQVLRGVKSVHDWYIDRVAALCAPVSSSGASLAAVTEGDAIGGPGGNKVRFPTCREGDAVVGMSGRAGAWIDSLTIWCRRLVSPTRVTGTKYSLSAGGGSTGTAVGARTCLNDRPVVKLSGRYTSYVNQLAMTCAG